MALIEVKVPQLSESVAEATLLQWKKKAGEAVAQDEILIEIETDKVVLEVPAPSAGVLAEIVGGYNTEYGGMRFGSYFMAEYMEVLVISGIAATCFFGGWHGPGPASPSDDNRTDKNSGVSPSWL